MDVGHRIRHVIVRNARTLLSSIIRLPLIIRNQVRSWCAWKSVQ
jgi:hypothetical protein